MKKPGWLKDAVATENGYVSPKGELLKSAKLSQAHIDEWNGIKTSPQANVVVVEEIEEELSEDLEELSKIELEEIGRDHGIELDRRRNKNTLIDQLKEYVSSSE